MSPILFNRPSEMSKTIGWTSCSAGTPLAGPVKKWSWISVSNQHFQRLEGMYKPGQETLRTNGPLGGYSIAISSWIILFPPLIVCESSNSEVGGAVKATYFNFFRGSEMAYWLILKAQKHLRKVACTVPPILFSLANTYFLIVYPLDSLWVFQKNILSDHAFLVVQNYLWMHKV